MKQINQKLKKKKTEQRYPLSRNKIWLIKKDGITKNIRK